MTDPRNNDYDDSDALLRQVDDLVGAPAVRYDPRVGDLTPEDEFDDACEDYDDSGAAFDPEDDSDFDPDEPEDGSVAYRNYSNHYGADVRNFSNGYGAGRAAVPEPEPAPSIPAYNADFRRAPRESRSAAHPAPRRREAPAAPVYEPEPPRPQKKHRKKRRRGCGCLPIVLMLLLVLVGGSVAAWHFLVVPPVSDDAIGARKADAATILVCGTDLDGTRTDTMMLIHLDGEAHAVSLLSLPRDSYVRTTGGNPVKLNSIYGLNGCGKEGMEGLLSHVQNIIGYRPDGYVLVNMDLVPQIVDLMGGLDVEVPQSFDLEGVHLEAGMQHLTGTEVLKLLRFRKGYAMQDLGRVEVQRTVVRAAMEQWVSLTHLSDAVGSLKLVKNHSLDTLTVPNYIWIAKTVLGGMQNFTTQTLPGTADYMDGVSYYLLNPGEIASLVNESYNPYEVEIRPENLTIAG